MVDFGGTTTVILGLCKIGDTPRVCLGKMGIMAIFAGFITSVWGLAKVCKVVVYKPFDYTYLYLPQTHENPSPSYILLLE